MDVPLGFWAGFIAFVLLMLALDLGVFNRKAHAVTVREAAAWTSVWVTLALLFNLGLYFVAGPQKAVEFLTGYVIEYSLSVDNIFVFVLIFSSFGVPAKYQHRVLFWGILGALLMRGAMIGIGAALISQFHWILYGFGAFLVVAGVRMFMSKEEDEVSLENNRVLRLVRRVVPVTNRYHEQRFFTRENGVRMATPLFLVLILIELTDLVFAVDSIPAIFAITQDPFIVFTSNIFAILGLRSLYFLLAGIIHKFVYLRYGLAVVLTYVGVKMLLLDVFHIPTLVSLGVIVSVLGSSIVLSLLKTRGKTPEDLGAPLAPSIKPSGELR
jgi:tellurite resistance protein TerC